MINLPTNFERPYSYMIFVPVVSLMQQINKVREIKSSLKLLDTFENHQKNYADLRSIYKWHVIGSLVQSFILGVITRLFPLFAFVGLISFYESCSSFSAYQHNDYIMKEDKGTGKYSFTFLC